MGKTEKLVWSELYEDYVYLDKDGHTIPPDGFEESWLEDEDYGPGGDLK